MTASVPLKRRILGFLLISLLIPVLFSCDDGRDKYVNAVAEAERALISPEDGMMVPEKAEELVRLYEGFVRKYPGDSLGAHYLQKAGEICRNTGQAGKAIGYFDQVRQQYPDHPRAATCLFLKGFVYENFVADLTAARDAYIEFIKTYPQHDFADDAQVLLTHLGKSPEEILGNQE